VDIHLQFALTADDFIECRREVHRLAQEGPAGKARTKPSFSRFTWALVAILAVILIVGLSLSQGRSASRTGQGQAFPTGAIVACLVTAGLILLYALRHRIWEHIFRRAFKNSPGLADAQEATLCDADLTVRTETMTTTQSWNHFTRFVESEGLFLLLIPTHPAQMLPKRAFGSAQEVDEFRGFALAHVGNTPLGFPVQIADPPKTPTKEVV
jgi:hypothetical protein